MRIADLTHTITEQMPVYPGTEQPLLKTANTIEKDGFRETLLHMYSHTGTHMDAPAHMFADKPTLDRMEANSFAGRAVAVDCREIPRGGRITAANITDTPGYSEAEFLLFCTGWDRKWYEDGYFSGFPVMDESAAKLVLELKLKGVGVDCISVDPVDVYTNHDRLLPEGVVLIENLTGLDALIGRSFDFFALPLKFIDSDGAPVRAVAVLA